MRKVTNLTKRVFLLFIIPVFLFGAVMAQISSFENLSKGLLETFVSPKSLLSNKLSSTETDGDVSGNSDKLKLSQEINDYNALRAQMLNRTDPTEKELLQQQLSQKKQEIKQAIL